VQVTVKVSAIIPVYNPGSHIDDCVASLLNQSLPREDYEVIFVDDGSTDGTPDRLEDLAAQHPHVSVIRIPNSGWPGRPRNVGIDRARGRYVYFIDNDDWVGAEALERLYDFAVRCDSDIVLGKIVGHRRPIPKEVFRHNRERTVLGKDPVLSVLTPHRLFRKSFLDEHGLRFAEGPVRLEDHLLVTHAHLHAKVASVLSDYPCYHWVRRQDESNASHRRFDVPGYYGHVREVLDVVDRHVPPGPLRDQLTRQWYQGVCLGRMGGSWMLHHPPEFRDQLFAEIRALSLERFGPGVVAGLPVGHRVRSRLLRAGRLDALMALAAVESGIGLEVTTDALRWDDGVLVVKVGAEQVYAGGAPVTYARRDGLLYWELPPSIADVPEIVAADLEVTEQLRRCPFDVLVRSRRTNADFLMPTARDREEFDDGGLRVRWCAEARIDVTSAAAGAPLDAGVWDVSARVVNGGWDVERRLPVADAALPASRVVGASGRVVIPYSTIYGNLSIDIDQTKHSLLPAVPTVPRQVRLRVDRRSAVLEIPLPAGAAAGTPVLPAELVLTRGGRRRTSAARLAAVDGRLVLTGTVDLRQVPPGRWRVRARVGERERDLGLRLDRPTWRAALIGRRTSLSETGTTPARSSGPGEIRGQ